MEFLRRYSKYFEFCTQEQCNLERKTSVPPLYTQISYQLTTK